MHFILKGFENKFLIHDLLFFDSSSFPTLTTMDCLITLLFSTVKFSLMINNSCNSIYCSSCIIFYSELIILFWLAVSSAAWNISDALNIVLNSLPRRWTNLTLSNLMDSSFVSMFSTLSKAISNFWYLSKSYFN